MNIPGSPGDPLAPRKTTLPPPDEPMAVARALIDDRTTEGLRQIQRWRGGWMTWLGPRWAEAEHEAVRAWVYTQLEHAVFQTVTARGAVVLVPWLPNRYKVANVMESLMAVAYLDGDTGMPSWIDRRGPVPAGEIVACANGLLHAGSRKLFDHTPAHFGLVAVPFDYQPDAPPPIKWLAFLNELWPGDPESIRALQEWFGYTISGRTDLQKILLLVGPFRGGKGTVARILTAMIGAAHVAGPTLASLGERFGLWPLIGRPLAIISDARIPRNAENSRIVERLLSISGEDRLTIDRKNLTPWSGTLPTRFLLLSNELPALGDASGAVATRFVVLQLTESWLGRENTGLTAELLAELPSVLSWALEGLDRLNRTGKITEPQSSRDAVRQLHDLASPVAAFLRDWTAPGKEVQCLTLYGAYRSWCEIRGVRPLDYATFGKDLRATRPTVRRGRPREGTSRPYTYYGLHLRDPQDREAE
jgi:putative DNA primase/helicase